MATKHPGVDAYIAKAAPFAKPILKHIRERVHATCPDAVETLKWGMPHFIYKEKNLCNMASFKQHCAFGFWFSSLLDLDKKSTEAMGQFGRITSLADLPKDRQFTQYIKQAMKLEDDGVKPAPKPKSAEKKTLDVPDYFSSALKKNKKAHATFNGFSYSNRKEYVEWVTDAKGEDTRARRLQTAIEWMAEGKIRNWKYVRK